MQQRHQRIQLSAHDWNTNQNLQSRLLEIFLVITMGGLRLIPQIELPECGRSRVYDSALQL